MECILLPNQLSVKVKEMVSNVASATLVTIKPSNEDDWEVLELNAELAEAAILKQVIKGKAYDMLDNKDANFCSLLFV